MDGWTLMAISRVESLRGTTAEWAALIRPLTRGQLGIDKTLGVAKLGNGVDLFPALPIYSGGEGPAFDVQVAAEISSAGSATDVALLTRDQQIMTDKDRALRTWYVAALKADSAACDIIVPTTDSIGAGAYAVAQSKTFLQTMLARLRRGLVPQSVIGGSGFYGFADDPILTGSGFIGATGSITATSAWGLGLKGIILNNAATLSYYFIGTTAKLRYRKDPTFGSFTYTIDGGAPVGPISATGAAATAEVTIGPLTSGVHTIVITATGSAGLIGSQNMDGDETVGVRLTVGSHAAYSALDFASVMTWTQDLAFVPNAKLAIFPIGSNDFYTGRTPAQARASIETLIAATRAATSATISIVLMAYYDRPAPAAVVPWSDYVDMYRDLAADDDWITLFDAGPLFGPMLSSTDDRNGLTTAAPGDYVHPTPEGHRLLGNALADFLMPPGATGSQGTTSTPADVLNAANSKQVYTNLGNFGGAANFSAVTIGAYSLTATANITLAAAAMFPVTAGKTAHGYIRVVQGGAGSFTFTPGVGIKVPYPLVMQTAVGAVDILHCFWDGAEWLIENMAYPGISTQVGAAVLLATNDLAAAYTSAAFSGPIVLSSLSINVYNTFRLVLTGAVSYSSTSKPAGLVAGKAATYRMVLVQGGAGNFGLTLNANVLTEGADPVLSTPVGAIDVLDYLWTGTETILIGFKKGVA